MFNMKDMIEKCQNTNFNVNKESKIEKKYKI